MSISQKLAFVLLVATFTIPAIAYNHDKVVKETKMTLHFQDTFGGPNATTIIYTGIPGKRWAPDTFASTFVLDDPMTEGPDKNSQELARAQGIYVVSSLNGSNAHTLFSVVFSSKEYYDSTLEIQGRIASQLDRVTEVSVVGGTGKFRFARGFATFELLRAKFLPVEVLYSVTRFNITVLHY